MKTYLTLAIFLLSLGCPLFAQESTDSKKITEETKKPENQKMKELSQKFSNLPEKSRKAFYVKFVRIQNLFNQKRIFDILEEADKIDKIFPNHPAILNIKGACYVEIRAFDKAAKVFQKISALTPDDANILFNLTEIDFVTKKWASAEKRYKKLIPMIPTQNKTMIRLCEFKLLLCSIKLNKKDQAISIKNKYDEWDDSPLYYYSRAALAYDKGDSSEAEKQRLNARFVWGKNANLSTWQDALIEFGYLQSFYGSGASEK